MKTPFGILTVLAGLLSANCGSSLNVAPRAEEPVGEWVPVTSMPPPPLPEEIPPLADDQSDLVWCDGCWEWSIGRWVWVRGGWVNMPQGGAYFAGRIVVDQEGGLLWAPCNWIVAGNVIDTPIPEVPARYPASARTVAR